KNALTSKLDNAIDKYNAGDFIAAKNILNAFLNQLNQFVTDGLISLAEAQPLIDYVNQIIAAINSSLSKVEGERNEQLPEEFALYQNYPNPFNPSTTINWQSPMDGWQTLKIYDLLGRETATLVDEYRAAGSYEVMFDAAGLSSGVYFYTLQANGFIQSKKLLLMK
ncbi:MAG: T9SS type A sorting domain-containing protein, partial [Ignavibacteriaceae bacterium]